VAEDQRQRHRHPLVLHRDVGVTDPDGVHLDQYFPARGASSSSSSMTNRWPVSLTTAALMSIS
jgi:hypothetical protein